MYYDDEVISVKESKLRQKRELDTKRRLTWGTNLTVFPPKEKRRICTSTAKRVGASDIDAEMP